MGEIASYPLSVWPKGPQPVTSVSCRTDASAAHLATSLDKAVVVSTSTPVHKAHGVQGAATVKMKRGHVSKACTNCRKMHAGCDLARPCSRCVFHRMESSCVDIPRKKRVSKKKLSGDTSSPEITTAIVIDTKKENMRTASSGVWKDTYSDLFGEFPMPTTSTTSVSTIANPSTAYFPTLADIVGSDSDSNRSLPHTPTGSSSDLFADEAALLAAMDQPQPKQDLVELKEQMDELRQSNLALENKLNNVTQELTEMRQKMQQMLHLLGGFLVSPSTPNSSLSSNSSSNSSSSVLGLPLSQDFPDL